MRKIVRKYEPGVGFTDVEGLVSFEEVRSQLNGYIEFINLSKIVSGLKEDITIFCDEEGLIKALDPCICIRTDMGRDLILVGTVFIGKLDKSGNLNPIDEDAMNEFSANIKAY